MAESSVNGIQREREKEGMEVYGVLWAVVCCVNVIRGKQSFSSAAP
ncbi:hypothetical protein SLEP1_g12785 [Rubroshorea leprosula]|uniref:Uncharacterized protein n=1 Tax=Rubroshorea leprosula TaxID=152421 RepID=A0AAV5IDN2_9ROSI|nr:hypothetical protein SLEP1_g12785 [Rubroshorea leprosula]